MTDVIEMGVPDMSPPLASLLSWEAELLLDSPPPGPSLLELRVDARDLVVSTGVRLTGGPAKEKWDVAISASWQRRGIAQLTNCNLIN